MHPTGDKPGTRLSRAAKAPPRAFSLLELLAVCAVVTILLAATLPAAKGLMHSSGRAAAVDGLMALLEQTRSLAIAQGRPAYLAFADATMGADYRCRAACIYQEAEDPSLPPVRLTGWKLLPTGFCLNPDPALPSLLTAPPEASGVAFPLGGGSAPRTLPYLKFGPTGAVLHPSESQWLRVLLVAGYLDDAGTAIPTAREGTVGSGEIEVSPFTGRSKYRFGL